MGIVHLAFAIMAIQGMGDWKVVATSATKTVWTMRAQDIANETELKRRVWTNLDHSQDKTVSYRSAKQRIVIGCLAETYQTLSVVAYDGSGKVVDSVTNPENAYRFEPIVPETVMEAVARSACPTGKSGS